MPNGSTPGSTGGVGVGAWISVGDSALRSMLASEQGVSMVGGIAMGSTLKPIWQQTQLFRDGWWQ